RARQAPSMGSRTSSRHQTGVHYRRASHGPPDVPPSAFPTPSTVSSSDPLVGLFHPTATSRLRFRGFLPPPSPRRLVAVALLPAVGVELLPSLSRWRRLPARR